jgi:hypothetical protein
VWQRVHKTSASPNGTGEWVRVATLYVPMDVFHPAASSSDGWHAEHVTPCHWLAGIVLLRAALAPASACSGE